MEGEGGGGREGGIRKDFQQTQDPTAIPPERATDGWELSPDRVIKSNMTFYHSYSHRNWEVI